MRIIGISCWYHDSAVAYIENSKIICAAQEERFSRKKHDPNFPINSLMWILDEHNLDINDIDYIAFYEDPKLKLKRIKYTHSLNWPNSYKKYLSDMKSQEFKINVSNYIRKNFNFKGKFYFCKHHISHAASAFYPSPYSRAAFLTIDGVGEYETTTFGLGTKKNLSIKKRIHFPHSLGLIYSAFTYYCGFKVNSGEYKLMGLAPYGKPIFKDLILKNLIDVKKDGSFRLQMKYFGHLGGDNAITKEFEKLFDNPRRRPETDINQFYMNIAASIQVVIEEVFLQICKYVQSETKMDNLCLAGGVALNCVANGKLLKSGIFKNIWIQPAAGDAGGALGAALYCANKLDSKNETINYMNPYLGPAFSDQDIKIYLDKNKINYVKSEDIAFETASLIRDGKIIGWFQGNSEFGPRALGNRSILGNPMIKNMQKEINMKVKYRESFRPFAPVVLEEYAHEWFDLNVNINSPYMLLVTNINKAKLIGSYNNRNYNFEDLSIKRSLIPAVTHVDCSARIQTVSEKQNFLLSKLINHFNKLTGCPVLINTSFNVRGEPIVLTPKDAFRCFMMTQIDYLAMGNYLISKKQDFYTQAEKLSDEYSKIYPLD